MNKKYRLQLSIILITLIVFVLGWIASAAYLLNRGAENDSFQNYLAEIEKAFEESNEFSSVSDDIYNSEKQENTQKTESLFNDPDYWYEQVDTEYNFSFIHPIDWKVSIDYSGAGYVGGEWTVDYTGKTYFLCPSPSGCQDSPVIISATENLLTDEIIKKRREYSYNKDMQESQITLNGFPATELKLEGVWKEIIIEKESLTYSIFGNFIDDGLTKEEFEKVVSGFEFINL